jgi:aminoglycoside/choline kinase family phosphotransferase
MIQLDEQQAREFLAQNKIENCEIKKIAGDASFRSYYRVTLLSEPAFSEGLEGGSGAKEGVYKDIHDRLSSAPTEQSPLKVGFGAKTSILMFAPPGYEEIKPFIKIDEFLVSRGFSAPKIFACDEKLGFLLLEDLGDDTYSRALAFEKSKELELYKKACDCLLALHRMDAPKDLPLYNHAMLFREVMLFVDWYLPLRGQAMSLSEKAQFKFLWFQLFDLLDSENQILVLRDFHADNLMVLANRKVGLLDFQDAVIGAKSYDLVSLLEDARRDVDEENRAQIFDYYLKNSGCDREKFTRDYEILSLQRNIKIVGIFARLSLRDGKHNYLNFMPRVLGFVGSRLQSKNPIFSEISHLIQKFL